MFYERLGCAFSGAPLLEEEVSLADIEAKDISDLKRKSSAYKLRQSIEQVQGNGSRAVNRV